MLVPFITNGTGNNLTGPIITSLVQSILGSPATGLAKGNTTPISTNLNADALFNSATAPDANNATGNLPKAYLTIIFFNERFEYVSEGSTALRVMQAGDGADPLVIPNVKAPKNGFAYVYSSNWIFRSKVSHHSGQSEPPQNFVLKAHIRA